MLPIFLVSFLPVLVSQFPLNRSETSSFFVSSHLVRRIPQGEAAAGGGGGGRGTVVDWSLPSLRNSLPESDLSCRKADFPRGSWGRAHESCK